MPQLAPLHWLFLSLTFWFIIMTVMSLLWWSQSPQTHIKSSTSDKAPSRVWLW